MNPAVETLACSRGRSFLALATSARAARQGLMMPSRTRRRDLSANRYRRATVSSERCRYTVARDNRQLNKAIHRIALTQTIYDGPGKQYFQRRLAGGDSRRRALRSLKRRITRVVYNRLKACRPATASPVLPERKLPQVFLLSLADLQPGRERRAAAVKLDALRGDTPGVYAPTSAETVGADAEPGRRRTSVNTAGSCRVSWKRLGPEHRCTR